MFNSEHEMPMAIVSEKEYNAEVRKQKESKLEKFIMPRSATMVITDMANDMMKIDRTKPHEIKINGQTQSVQLNKPTLFSVLMIVNISL